MREVKVTEVPQGAQLIDVREEDEFATGHAAGAINIPMSEITSRVRDLDGTEDIYVICQLGGRSAKVAEFLEEQDFPVINVEGGTSAWIKAGLPTE
jgi:hypothetical protein